MSELQLDIRVGCVAVYRGKPVNCFASLPEGKDLLFYADGKWKNGRWVLPKYKIVVAKIVYWWNRRAEASHEQG